MTEAVFLAFVGVLLLLLCLVGMFLFLVRLPIILAADQNSDIDTGYEYKKFKFWYKSQRKNPSDNNSGKNKTEE